MKAAKASIGKSMASRCLWRFLRVKIWSIKIFCLSLPVVTTNIDALEINRQ